MPTETQVSFGRKTQSRICGFHPQEGPVETWCCEQLDIIFALGQASSERLTLTHTVWFVQSKGTVTHWVDTHVRGAVGL